MNINGKLRKNWGSQAKIWGGYGARRSPRRIDTSQKVLSPLTEYDDIIRGALISLASGLPHPNSATG